MPDCGVDCEVLAQSTAAVIDLVYISISNVFKYQHGMAQNGGDEKRRRLNETASVAEDLIVWWLTEDMTQKRGHRKVCILHCAMPPPRSWGSVTPRA